MLKADELKLVVTYMEYIRQLIKENERKDKIIEAMREGLSSIRCDCCGSCYTAEKALEQADKIANGTDD